MAKRVTAQMDGHVYTVKVRKTSAIPWTRGPDTKLRKLKRAWVG